MHELSEHAKWEREVINLLIEKLEISNGDAQGIVEAHSFEMAQSWSGAMTAEETAERLVKL